jgi:hypothetical protein
MKYEEFIAKKSFQRKPQGIDAPLFAAQPEDEEMEEVEA